MDGSLLTAEDLVRGDGRVRERASDGAVQTMDNPVQS